MKTKSITAILLIPLIFLLSANIVFGNMPFSATEELVTNHDFSSETSNWNIVGNGECTGGYTAIYDGENGILMSGDEYKRDLGCRTYIYQTVQVPENVGNVVLSFTVAATSRTCGSTTANVFVGIKPGNTIEESYSTTRNFEPIIEGGFNEREKCAPNFKKYNANVDLSEYQGSEVVVYGIIGDAWEKDHRQKAWFKSISLTNNPNIPITTSDIEEVITSTPSTIKTTTPSYGTTSTTSYRTTTTQPKYILPKTEDKGILDSILPKQLIDQILSPFDFILKPINKQICLTIAQFNGVLPNC